MAGRKHHHVPQLLQRRFGFQGAKATKIVVYSANKAPFVTSTANYGAERDFYADGADFFVDDLITDFEGDIQSFVIKLIDGDTDALNDRATIAALIAHLEMRSMFLRNQLFEISGMAGDLIESIFLDRKNLVRILHNHIKENPKILRDGLVEHLGQRAPISALEEFIMPQIKTHIDQQSAALVETLADVLSGMRSALNSAVKPAHLKALMDHPSDSNRAKFYSDLNYTIQRAPLSSFILPDTMIAFCTKKKVRPFTQKGDDLVELFLPLASDVVLVGSKRRARFRSVQEVNSMLASVSFGSFIGLDNKSELRALASRIGKNAHILSPSDSKIIFRDIFRDMIGKT